MGLPGPALRPAHEKGVVLGGLFVLLITIVAIADGVLLVAASRAPLGGWMRLAAGSVAGLALLAWAGFLTALIFGLGAVSIGATCLALVIIPAALSRVVSIPEVYGEMRADLAKWTGGAVVYYSMWALLLAALFSRVIVFESGALLTAPANNYGDLPFHLSAITSFAWGENLPPDNPIFAGYRFTYPFLIDFLTAFFLRAGAGWRLAFFIENFTLALALVALIEFLTRTLTANKTAGRIAPLLLLFNGGFGFISFLHQAANAPSLSALLAALPGTYTMNADLPTPWGEVPLRWGNAFTTLLIPQRSLLFGLPIAALIVALWRLAIDREKDPQLRRRWMAAAGVLAGMLPMLHAHGFFSIMIVAPLLFVLFRSLDWAWFFVPAGVLSAPQALYLGSTPVKNQLFKFQPGWESGDASVLLFWAANAGLFLLLLAGAFALPKLLDSGTRKFASVFLVWFLLPNLVLLAPWPWDNIKMLIYWALVSSPLVAALLADWFRRGVVWGAGATALLVMLTLAGALDVWRGFSPVEKVTLLGAAEVEVAALIRQQTEPRSVILHAPIHNSTVCLTGRQSVMGYPGHLWTHGISYQERELEVESILRWAANAEQLIDERGVDYLLIGPTERSKFRPPEMLLGSRYPVVFEHADYKLFRVRK